MAFLHNHVFLRDGEKCRTTWVEWTFTVMVKWLGTHSYDWFVLHLSSTYKQMKTDVLFQRAPLEHVSPSSLQTKKKKGEEGGKIETAGGGCLWNYTDGLVSSDLKASV